MPELGAPELLIILAIVVVLFGTSRMADVGSSLGRAIRDFRRELGKDVDDEGDGADASANEHKSTGP
jgi:sec-independent protein translocase protein TatA